MGKLCNEFEYVHIQYVLYVYMCVFAYPNRACTYVVTLGAYSVYTVCNDLS